MFATYVARLQWRGLIGHTGIHYTENYTTSLPQGFLPSGKSSDLHHFQTWAVIGDNVYVLNPENRGWEEIMI